MQSIAFLPGVQLRSLNTLALPAVAEAFVVIRTPDQLAVVRTCAEFAGRKRLVLGSGSNVVLSGDFDGFVLQIQIPGRQFLREDEAAHYVRAGAGENWNAFVGWTLQNGWPGLENLALIPGTVGAAPIQNIGAYGLEVCERFDSLEAYDLLEGSLRRFSQTECRFFYRDSIFKQEGWHLSGRFVVTSVTFRLPKAWRAITNYKELAIELEPLGGRPPSPKQIADAVVAVRSRKLPDPGVLPNAGSFFQNPVVTAATAAQLALKYPQLPRYPQSNGQVKLAAGWLIEQAGWKGRNLGPAGMYERQALVLVNRGGACGRDVVALARAVTADVRRLFGIELQPEPSFF
jgi:UDP-N-acetylmuramate dehydrogenase